MGLHFHTFDLHRPIFEEISTWSDAFSVVSSHLSKSQFLGFQGRRFLVVIYGQSSEFFVRGYTYVRMFITYYPQIFPVTG